MSTMRPNSVSTTNPCKLCTPLGACLAFRGVEGAMPYLHGSQGCATYMRRYIISHFNEPIDIASSALGEKHAVYGGGPNLKLGLKNVCAKYKSALVGIATTCLTETIGDDVSLFLHEYRKEAGDKELPLLVQVSTPSYSGTHMEGFHGATLALVKTLAGEEKTRAINLLPGFLSPADIRHLKDVCEDFGLAATILPDISDTLDGPALADYPLLPAGGTPISAIKTMGGAPLTIEFGSTLGAKSGGTYLAEHYGVPNRRLGFPMGLRANDTFLDCLATASARPVPARYGAARGRLIDAMVDGHKYVSGRRAIVYGEEDLVVGLVGFLAEIGVQPVLCASGGRSGRLKEAIDEAAGSLLIEPMEIREGMDFHEIAELAESLKPDLLVGHSKGYPLARKLDIPLVRVGFPIHDRLGGQRILHIGYEGAQRLFDQIVNELLRYKQENSPVGYSYM